MAYICMRRVGSCTHVMHPIVHFVGWCIIASVGGSFVLGIQWVLPGWKWWIGMLVATVLGFVGQLVLTMGLARVPAGRGALALYVAVSGRTFGHWIKLRRLTLWGSRSSSP